MSKGLIGCRKSFLLIAASLFFLSGCASVAVKLVSGGKAVTIPQIVAHLEPVLRDNKIILSGNIVIQNPTESDIRLGKIYLLIKGEHKDVIEKADLEWSRENVQSRTVLESPLKIVLDLSVLNQKEISVEFKTVIIYKKFDIAIPIENKLAVLHLDSLRESIVRPFDVALYTKLRSNIFNASIDYTFDIANPVGIDLSLENSQILIYSGKQEIARTVLSDTLFPAGQSGKIEGVIKIEKFLNKILRSELVKKHPLTFTLKGDLRVPHTEISMPFKVESIQSVDFSLFGNRK